MSMMNVQKLAWLGSVALMGGALAFQYIGGMDPCVLCLYQRVPHIAVILIGVYAAWRVPALGWLMALILLAGAGIAGFHVGVELHWWEGLASCSGGTGLTVDELLATAPARCDQIPWALFGLSMAAWNMVLSIILALGWVLGARRSVLR